MRKSLSTIAAAAVVITFVLVAGATAVAKGKATPLLVGHANKAKKTTTLTNKKAGAALALNSMPGSPPLAVNSSTKVSNLNADTVDGFDSSTLVNATTKQYVFASTANQGSGGVYLVDQLAPGSYLVTFRASILPGSSPTQTQCQLRLGTARYAGQMVPFTNLYAALLSGADLITTATPAPLQVSCDINGGTFTFFEPLVVTVTRTGDGGTGTITRLP
jgi:hypothetical protein